MQFRPAIEILKRIIGPIVGAPAHEALKVALVIVIFIEELLAGGNVVGQELPLQHGPTRSFHGCVDADNRFGTNDRSIDATDGKRQ